MDLKKLKGGTPGKFILDNIDQVHNCYSDLKNKWNDNAKEFNEEKLKFIYTVTAVFILGFLFSQLRTYISQDTNLPLIDEPFPVNMTKVTQDSDLYIDFANTQYGGSIIPEYSVPEYLGWFSVFSNNKRESVISQNNEPGSCWPFEGSYGYIGIKLSKKVKLKSFTIIHLDTLNYANAPKILKVYSLSHLDESALLAQHDFDLKIKSEKRKNSQNFLCQYNCDEPVDHILLEVLSNHGGDKTCVYQFKAHGIPIE